MKSPRELVYKLFSLSYPTRMKLIKSLDLWKDEDQGIPKPELIRRVVQRARIEGRLEDLRKAIITKGADNE